MVDGGMKRRDGESDGGGGGGGRKIINKIIERCHFIYYALNERTESKGHEQNYSANGGHEGGLQINRKTIGATVAPLSGSVRCVRINMVQMIIPLPKPVAPSGAASTVSI